MRALYLIVGVLAGMAFHGIHALEVIDAQEEAFNRVVPVHMLSAFNDGWQLGRMHTAGHLRGVVFECLEELERFQKRKCY